MDWFRLAWVSTFAILRNPKLGGGVHKNTVSSEVDTLKVLGGNQCELGDSFTVVKSRRSR